MNTTLKVVRTIVVAVVASLAVVGFFAIIYAATMEMMGHRVHAHTVPLGVGCLFACVFLQFVTRPGTRLDIWKDEP